MPTTTTRWSPSWLDPDSSQTAQTGGEQSPKEEGHTFPTKDLPDISLSDTLVSFLVAISWNICVITFSTAWINITHLLIIFIINLKQAPPPSSVLFMNNTCGIMRKILLKSENCQFFYSHILSWSKTHFWHDSNKAFFPIFWSARVWNTVVCLREQLCLPNVSCLLLNQPVKINLPFQTSSHQTLRCFACN